MGLDQKIILFKKQKNNNNLYERKEYYFRKVNCLQGYFEREIDIQNCDIKGISKEHIEKIQDITNYILNNKNDIEYINENFPTTQGFFYGSYEIDNDYFEDIAYINEIINEILENFDSEDYLFYWCWY